MKNIISKVLIKSVLVNNSYYSKVEKNIKENTIESLLVENKMNCEFKNIFKINAGSRAECTLIINDERNGNRLDLSVFDSGSIFIPLTNGTNLEKSLTLPGSDPKLGTIDFTLTSSDTDKLDSNVKDFELELNYTSGSDKLILSYKNSIEVIERVKK